MNNNSTWGTKEGVFKVATIAGVMLAVFLLTVSIQGLKGLWKNSDPIMTSISVQGKGEVVVIPDIATFSFSVEETADTVDAAQKKATDAIAAALKGVRAGGVEDKDIKTLSYSIYPKYENEPTICTPYQCAPTKSKLVGYQVTQSVQVKVRKIENAGALFQTVVAAGIKNINNLSFSVDTIDSVKDKARIAAINDARARAEVLAKSLGITLVRVTGYYEDAGYGYGGGDMMKTFEAASPSASRVPEIPVGENKVTSTVNVMFEIR